MRWLRRRGSEFTVEHFNDPVDCTPPVFSPGGSELLLQSHDSSIRRLAFPDMALLGGPLETGDPDDPFQESICYLDEGHALAGTGAGRIFVIDTQEMAIVDEIALEGHEPRPMGEYFPRLAAETGLATDLTWFARVGDTILFAYRRDEQSNPIRWKDSLVWYSLKG